jgi:type II secretory pathway component PulF|tara:strand:- start:2 stop:292 length:291 start_codon:yes stop_codon:yes gene_type:complete
MRKISMLKNDKRGLALGDLYPAVLMIVLVGIVLGIGLYVLAQVEANITGGSTQINTTITGLGGLASWIAVIVVVIAAAIVLGVVISSFGGSRRSGV